MLGIPTGLSGQFTSKLIINVVSVMAFQEAQQKVKLVAQDGGAEGGGQKSKAQLRAERRVMQVCAD